MSIRQLAAYAIVCVVGVVSAAASEPARLGAMLDEAERTRATDKAKARQILDAVERDSEAQADPLLVARVQLLECKWSDVPAQAYPRVTAGLAAADRAHNADLRAKLLACRATALMADGNTIAAEQELGTAATLAKQLHDPSLQADALGNLGYLQYNRGAMAEALTNLQAAYALSSQIGDTKGRLDALSMIANVYADNHVAQYDRAIEYYRQLIGEYEKFGQPNDVADTLFNIGSTFETKGDYAGAELYYRRSLASFQKLKRAGDIAFTKRALGSALMKAGKSSEALQLLDSALDYYRREKDEANVATTRQYRGLAYRRMGRRRMRSSSSTPRAATSRRRRTSASWRRTSTRCRWRTRSSATGTTRTTPPCATLRSSRRSPRRAATSFRPACAWHSTPRKRTTRIAHSHAKTHCARRR